MHRTPWREYRENGHTYRIRAEYGWQALGAQEPYWSITGTIEQKAGTRWRDDAGGCHAEIAQHFPALAPTIKWQLVFQESGPLHYVENARYWLEQAHGIFRWPRNSYDPDPVMAFKRTVVFGAVDTDTELPQLEDLEAWAAARLPALQARLKVETDAVLAAHA